MSRRGGAVSDAINEVKDLNSSGVLRKIEIGAFNVGVVAVILFIIVAILIIVVAMFLVSAINATIAEKTCVGGDNSGSMKWKWWSFGIALAVLIIFVFIMFASLRASMRV